MGKRSREEEHDDEDKEQHHSHADTSPTRCPFCSTVIYGYNGFQNHFLTFHEYQCLTCDKVFPSRHILDLHIDEYHNPFLKLQLERGEAKSSLRCFSETCNAKFDSSQARIVHLIDHHHYPKTYPFSITSQGISQTLEL
ncbi:hypothetical protein CANMA_002339 [Candida margitis]|uniref:uncharacterized protein n=1 Tax=Candida margitis TaxID=1775924 RepID=UPI0022263E4B|nr:uncharacterized protein CANMA_002339 [Candida margitis]KAI5968594.1 hypothetical protein CANMA_002339 [Candida margitis]